MRREAPVYLALLILILVTYWPVTGCDFVNYDDPVYVSRNTHVQSGLTVESVRWAFTTTEGSNYWHPLTWLSYMLDCQIFGLNPHACHATNLGFHAANALLLLLVLQRLTGTLWQSAFVAALFAVHPLHVESVAWVAERKDVLSSFFGLLTILIYIGYARHKTTWKYLLVVLSYAFGLMAKPMMVTLPLLLLLLDFWPLKRFAFQARGEAISASDSGLSVGLLFAEKVPLLVLALADSVLTIVAQVRGATVESLANLPVGGRLANAAFGYVLYLGKMFWPVHLAVFYPYHPVPTLQVLLACTLLVSITWVALTKARALPYFLVGWLWFLIMLFPVSGLVQSGAQALADRYSYMSLIGPFVIFTLGTVEAAKRFEWPTSIIAIAGTGLVLACALATRRQLVYWENSITLFSHAIDVTRGNAVAENNLGSALLDAGQREEAKRHLTAALQLKPDYPNAHFNSGLLFELEGKSAEAEAEFRAAIQYLPTYARAHKALATLLLSSSRYDDAESHLRTALDLQPDDNEARMDLGSALALQGKNDEAQKEFEALLHRIPANPTLHQNLGNVFAAEGDPEKAASEYSTALRLNSTNEIVREALAGLLVQKNKMDEASALLRQGLEMQPTVGLYAFLASVESKNGNAADAVRLYRKALQLKPDAPKILNNLAWILATDPDEKTRNGTEAVELAEKACKLSQYKQPIFIGTLAAAYAEAGRFPDAIAAEQKACDTASAAGMTEMLKKNQELLEAYRAGHAHREPQL